MLETNILNKLTLLKLINAIKIKYFILYTIKPIIVILLGGINHE